MHLRTLVPIFLALVSCSSPSEQVHLDEDDLTLGVIELSGDPIRLDMPTDVAAGQEFRVSVGTYGGGCVTKGEVEVELASQRATITPYDYDPSGNLPPNAFCDDMLRLIDHEAVLQFDRVGVAKVVIRGKRKPSGEIISIVRTIEVR